MAHFAKIDRVGTVVDVVVVDDAVLKDEDGNEVEQKGIDFLTELFGGAPQWDWKQTSYNACKGEHRMLRMPNENGEYCEPIQIECKETQYSILFEESERRAKAKGLRLPTIEEMKLKLE